MGDAQARGSLSAASENMGIPAQEKKESQLTANNALAANSVDKARARVYTAPLYALQSWQWIKSVYRPDGMKKTSSNTVLEGFPWPTIDLPSSATSRA